MAVKYRKSKTGYYNVELARTITVGGFDYKPGLAHVVNQVTLDAMLDVDDGEAVTHALPTT